MKDDIKNLIETSIATTDIFETEYELYEELDYDGSLQEIIDSEIDLNNYTLRKWAVENYSYIEQAQREGFLEGVQDYHTWIQVGQDLKLREESYEIVKDLFYEFNGVAFNCTEEEEE